MRSPEVVYVVSDAHGLLLVALTKIGAEKAITQVPGSHYVRVPCAHAIYRIDEAIHEARPV